MCFPGYSLTQNVIEWYIGSTAKRLCYCCQEDYHLHFDFGGHCPSMASILLEYDWFLSCFVYKEVCTCLSSGSLIHLALFVGIVVVSMALNDLVLGIHGSSPLLYRLISSVIHKMPLFLLVALLLY